MAILIKTKIPGPKSMALLKKRNKEVPSGIHSSADIFIDKAKGALLYDVDGNVLIDFAGGIGSINFGHCDKRIINAVNKQAKQYMHVGFQAMMYEPYVRLAEKINKISPIKNSKTILFNSGAEAVENAVKIARKFTGKAGVCVLEHAFHGRTLFSLGLTHKEEPYKLGFGPFDSNIYRLKTPYLYRKPEYLHEDEFTDACIDYARSFISENSDKIACVVIELVIGEGGFIALPKKYAQELRKICDENKVLLVIDEVQTGMGRTGRMFAVEHYGIIPDMILMAKSLGGGFPLSAVNGKQDIMDCVQAGGLGATFGGNPIACAAGLEAIEIIKKLLPRANEIGMIVMKRFNRMKDDYEIVGDARGLGAMCAIEVVENKISKKPANDLTREIQHDCLKNGLVILKAGLHDNVLRTLMPLVITNSQLNEGLDVLENAVKEVIGKNKK